MSSSKRIIRDAGGDMSGLETVLKETSAQPIRGRSAAHMPSDPVAEMLMAKKEAAYRQGYSDGYEWGAREAIELTKRQEEERILSFAHDLKALIARIESSMDLWFQKAEHGLATLSFEIAKKIVANELQLSPASIVPIVREALERVSNSNRAIIKLNPFDVAALNEHREKLMEVSGFIDGIEIVGDDKLQRGSVMIESDNGVIDATIETKLSRLREEQAA